MKFLGKVLLKYNKTIKLNISIISQKPITNKRENQPKEIFEMNQEQKQEIKDDLNFKDERKFFQSEAHEQLVYNFIEKIILKSF